MTLNILFEHSAGYGLFRVKEHEEISMFENEILKAAEDMSKFRSIVQLVAFMPFKTAEDALSNCNSVSEGVVHEDLVLFLESNVAKNKKLTFGVSDSKLGAAIQEAFGYSVQTTGVVPEIIRGIRLHFHHFIEGFTAVSSMKAQLGLGHSYSRAKVKFNVNRIDNMIIHSINLLDQLDKDINTFSMRIREWYGYHFPELVKFVTDNATYAKLVRFIKNRENLRPEHLEELESIVLDSSKAEAILKASRSSMGPAISPEDLINVVNFATKVIKLTDYRKSLAVYLGSKMSHIAPNLSTLIGDMVGARLISHAGSLTNLAKYPASTVQILGAEKALFRALKTRGNTPKYGLLFHSTFIGRAANQNKGRISRYLANKCSIASRIDCFSETQSTVFGEKLKEQVEERLKFYQSGAVPRKNIDVMKLAVEKNDENLKSQKKKKKKKKNRISAAGEEEPETKNNKRKLFDTSVDDTSMVNDTSLATEEVTPKKKAKKGKKKKMSIDVSMNNGSICSNGDLSVANESQVDSLKIEDNVTDVSLTKSKKKKKRKSNKE